MFNLTKWFVLGIVVVSAISCAPAATPIPPTATSVPTATPSLPPHSLVVIKSAISGSLLGITISDTDSDGEKLDTLIEF